MSAAEKTTRLVEAIDAIEALTDDRLELYAVPGEQSVIDMIHPATGLTCINGQTAEQVAERYPRAVRMTWQAWQAGAIERQETPITWTPTTRARFEEMLDVLPPAYWNGRALLVGEPWDHSFRTGAPRFQAFKLWRGGIWLVASRPLTRAELLAELVKP